MVVAVSITMVKNTGYNQLLFSKLSIVYNAESIESAKGEASTDALKDSDGYSIASICAGEVTLPPKEISEESAELRTTSLKSSLRKLFHNFF